MIYVYSLGLFHIYINLYIFISYFCKQIVLGHSDGVMCHSRMLWYIAVLPYCSLYMASKLDIIL